MLHTQDHEQEEPPPPPPPSEGPAAGVEEEEEGLGGGGFGGGAPDQQQETEDNEAAETEGETSRGGDTEGSSDEETSPRGGSMDAGDGDLQEGLGFSDGGAEGSEGAARRAAARGAVLDDDGEDDDEDLKRYDELTRMSRSGDSMRSRPGSAVADLRGSRPNSALIAQEIEGFEDDFMERVEEEEDDEYPEEGEDQEAETGPTIEELLERAQAEAQRLAGGNEALQRKVRMALDFRNRGRPQVKRDLSRLDGASSRYKSSLKQWIEALEERHAVESHYQGTIFDMKGTLEERIKRADDISKAYKHFRLEVARSSEHSKTGRSISDKLLAQLEAEDLDKEEEVQRVRLKNIHLSNQLRRIEQNLQQKEELAEGLHLIDFEQLKIENQSLNEKIEERNEELLKLRKKTTTTVQILTHVREKLQFVERENSAGKDVLEVLDQGLAAKRDRLGQSKAARDTLRLKGRKIQETSVYITNPHLLDDIETQKERKEVVATQIDTLRHEYAALSGTISRNNNKLMVMAEEISSQHHTGQQAALRAALSRAAK
ncbi:MAG: hypothetical protein WDW36_006043 [Sanguina aurantia]